MNGRDFLSLAEELLDVQFRRSSVESKHRTMVSRAYYALFLTLRDHIEAFGKGITYPSDASAHVKLQRDLNNSLPPHGPALARHLIDLRDARIRADYETGCQVAPPQAAQAIVSARAALNKFDAIKHSPQLMNDIRAYRAKS